MGKKIEDMDIEALNQALTQFQEEEKREKEQLEKLLKVKLPTALNDKSGSLTWDEQEQLEGLKVKIADKEIDITFETANYYPKAKRELIKQLAELRGVDYKKMAISDLTMWVDIVGFRTHKPLEFEGK